MPGKRPGASGYSRVAQAEEEEEEEQYPYSDRDDDPFTDPVRTISSTNSRYAPIQPRPHDHMHMPSYASTMKRPRRTRANSGVDIKAINARLERWAEEIKERFTRRRIKGKTSEEEQLEIHHSVFTAPDWLRPATKDVLDHDYDDGLGRLSKLEFDDLVESVRTAIDLGVHPKLISQGSSGSYFARNTGGKTVGVFKPKDEEPYASKNPKWTKWLHRNLLPFAFGRAMLIPNLSYVSEAAAYVLDCQLRTNIVPYTGVVGLSSQSFHYDWMDRRAFRRRKRALPEKLGSFQVFLKGYKGATDFFREHPWPDHHTASGVNGVAAPRKKKRRRWDEDCRPGSVPAQDDSEDETESNGGAGQSRARREFWTETLQQSFREELEKLVILDYIMRNTDRGTDNWMIRIDTEKQQAEIMKEPPSTIDGANGRDGYHRRAESMSTAQQAEDDIIVPRLGAIDNSLSWPWKHPDAWRSYPFGWLFLPVSLIGRPFSESTRRHFLPLLTSTQWWSDTQIKLRRCFEIDADFQEKMFARQIAVMKGQAWNVVEALKASDHGPLELTRRNRVLVWDDVVDIPVAVPLPRASEEMRKRAAAAAAAASATASSFPPTSSNDLDEEEMDITSGLHSTSHSDKITPHLISPPLEPSTNPFNQTRDSPPLQPQTNGTLTTERPSHHRSNTTLTVPRTPFTTRPHPSSRATDSIGAKNKRRFSLTFGSSSLNTRRSHTGRYAHGSYNYSGHEGGEEDEDDDGDLGGFAAAAGQERSSRRVIVERLEVVKTKTPFFEWC